MHMCQSWAEEGSVDVMLRDAAVMADNADLDGFCCRETSGLAVSAVESSV